MQAAIYVENSKRAWAEYGQWWRKTKQGKVYETTYSKKRRDDLKRKDAGMRVCKACGKEFSVSLYSSKRGRDLVCSAACRGRCRQNIKRYVFGGVEATLTELCDRFGVRLATAWARLKRGWTLERAIGAQQT
jgi:hypothetical protein